MAFQYRINILSELKEKGYSTYRLRKEKILAESTLQKIRNNKLLSWAELDTVCDLLNAQPGDLILHIPDSAPSQPVPENVKIPFPSNEQELAETISKMKFEALYDLFFEPFDIESYKEDLSYSRQNVFLDPYSEPDIMDAKERMSDYTNYIHRKREFEVLAKEYNL